MPTDLDKIWFWSYLLLALPAAVYYVMRLYSYFKRRRPQGDTSYAPATGRGSILRIEQREPSNRPPAVLSIVLITCTLFMLTLGVWVIYLWVVGKVAVRIDISTIFFFVLFLAFPIWVLVDNFVIQRRFYRLGRSMVAKEAEVVFEGNANIAFDACRRALDAMKVPIIKMNKPNLLKARLGKSVITVEIRHRKGSKVRVHILSDSQWLTVKFDVGANQRNIDTFLNELSRG